MICDPRLGWPPRRIEIEEHQKFPEAQECQGQEIPDLPPWPTRDCFANGLSIRRRAVLLTKVWHRHPKVSLHLLYERKVGRQVFTRILDLVNPSLISRGLLPLDCDRHD